MPFFSSQNSHSMFYRRFFIRCGAFIAGVSLALAGGGIARMHYSNETPHNLEQLFVSPTGIAYGAENKHPLSLDTSTAIITKSSGYSANFTITNTSNTDISAGTIHILTNPGFSFSNAKQLQDWADGILSVPMSTELTNAQVPALKKGESTQVSITIHHDDSALQALTSWGAKPLLLSYISNDTKLSDTLRTFVTRSNVGTPYESLPKLNFVLTVPASIGNIKQCSASKQILSNAQKTMSNLTNGNNFMNIHENAHGHNSNNANTHDVHNDIPYETCADNTLTALQKLTKDNPSIEILPDSTLAERATKNFNLQYDHTIQPYGIDISTLASAHHTDIAQSLWKNAPALEALYPAKKMQSLHSSPSENSEGSLGIPSTLSHNSHSQIAIDGLLPWSREGLKTAHDMGYSTVIADSEIPILANTIDNSLHNSIRNIRIDDFSMTVLTPDKLLSSLAQGIATSHTARAEQAESGLINRFMAQTAFYESQAPYTERIIFVNAASMKEDLDTHHTDFLTSLAHVLRDAAWTRLQNVNSLLDSNSNGYTNRPTQWTQNEHNNNVVSQRLQQSINKTINRIIKNTAQMKSFMDTIVDSAIVQSSDNQQPDQKQSRNPQNLAKGNADVKTHALTADELSQWQSAIYSLANSYATQALSTANLVSEQNIALKAHERIIKDLTQSITISVPQSLHIVSETATIPVTISNNLPVNLKINITSEKAHSSQSSLETKRSDVLIFDQNNLIIPHESEKQITLTVKAISGWTTKFNIYLTTKDGMQISQKHDITISSSIRIMDNAGYVIFALAIILGILGAKRQIARKRKKMFLRIR